MFEIRALLAVIAFSTGVYLVWDLYASGLNAVVLVTAVACFIFAHFIKPNTSSKAQNTSDLSLWDIIDLIVDIPFRLISVSLRALSKIVD